MSEPESAPPAATPPKELSGRIGKYEIVRPLGKGAMGVVYLAHDTILERDVALKVMVSQIADDPELNQRFIREAKAVAKMHHPNVVNVFDLGTHTDGSPFIAMELLKGQDLQKGMRAQPPMTLDRKVAVIVHTLAGLAHAHQQGIVHRDIKPANIFINDDGTVKIMDFGVARLTSASMTGTGNIVGTADYMSPEQVKGAKVDGRSDLFSVGCMLYELVTGRRPFHSDNLMAIFYKITHEEANFDLVPQGAEYDALMPLLQKSLAKDLEERYQTAYDFASALRDYLREYATPGSVDQSGLEGLLDDAAPTGAPAATLLGDEGGAAGTMEVGPTVVQDRPASSGRARTPTMPAARGSGRGTTPRTLAPTVVAASARTSVAGARPSGLPRPMPPEPSGHPILYVAVGGLTVALLVTGAYIYFQQQKPVDPPPVTIVDAPPATLAEPPPTTVVVEAPPSLAPPPTFAEATGSARIRESLRAAQSEFNRGNYDRAVTQAQRVLAEDPQNASARELVERALGGQRAEARFRSAEQALRANDYAKAEADAREGLSAAPWDARGTDLITRIQQAQRDSAAAQQRREVEQRRAQVQQQLNTYLSQADAALSGKNYDGAISLYDEALKLDASNQRAVMGRSTAIQARALAQAAQQRPGGTSGPAAKAFVASRTSAQSPEQRSGSNVPAGFEDSAEVEVKKGSQAAELPGKIHFDITPNNVRAGDRYTVKVFMQNEGNAPIQLESLLVNTKVNGRGIAGPVPPRTAALAPGQRGLLFETSDVWKEDTSAWTMEVSVRTARGERYTNQVTWK